MDNTGEHADDLVRVIDSETGKIHTIPARELASGMIQVAIEGKEGLYWIDASQIAAGEPKHAALSPEVKAAIPDLKAALDDVDPKSVEEWEAGFLQDKNPEKELQIWQLIAAVYSRVTEGKDLTLEQKKEYLQVLIKCTIASRAQVLLVTNLSAISKEEAEEAIRLYHGEE